LFALPFSNGHCDGELSSVNSKFKGEAAKVLASIAFVSVAFWFIYSSLRLDLDRIFELLASISYEDLVFSLVLNSLSLMLTAYLWILLVSELTGRRKNVRLAYLFFATQLGKYIPGSIWNYVAQASLLKGLGIAIRDSIAISAKLIYLLLISAFASGLLFSFHLFEGVGKWLLPLFGAVVLVGFHPTLLAKFLKWRTKFEPSQQKQLLGPIALVSLSVTIWLLQAFSIYVLIPKLQPNGLDLDLLLGLLSAICLSFVAGLLVPFAPAGLGVREAVLIFLLVPSLGVAQAGATAILLRLVQVVGDLLFGLISWVLVAAGRRS